MKIEVTVCNVCQEVGKPVEQYVVGRLGAPVELDLCADHAAPIEAPIEALLGGQPKGAGSRTPAKARKAPAKKAAAKKAAPRRRGTKVVSIEEIEAMKQG